MPHDIINRALGRSGISGGLPPEVASRLARLEAQVQRLGKGVSAPISAGIQIATTLINDGAVTAAKLASDAVETAKIKAGALIAHGDVTATATASKIPKADSGGKLAAGWGGSASTLATLDASSVVVEVVNKVKTTGPAGTAGHIGTSSGRLQVGDGTAARSYYHESGTDVAVADGGTGASTAAAALANLGGASVATGTYTGDGNVGGPAQTVGFRPRVVHINGTDGRFAMVQDAGGTDNECGIGQVGGSTMLVTASTVAADITANGFTPQSNSGSNDFSMNKNAHTYYWVAYK